MPGKRERIIVQRVYEKGAREEGSRFLVERLWPRGVRKGQLHASAWLKEVAPSDGLRKWFRHDPEKWAEFERRYFRELDEKPEAIQPLLEAARHGKVTLLYSARDTEHNNAVALQQYLEKRA